MIKSLSISVVITLSLLLTNITRSLSAEKSSGLCIEENNYYFLKVSHRDYSYPEYGLDEWVVLPTKKISLSEQINELSFDLNIVSLTSKLRQLGFIEVGECFEDTSIFDLNCLTISDKTFHLRSDNAFTLFKEREVLSLKLLEVNADINICNTNSSFFLKKSSYACVYRINKFSTFLDTSDIRFRSLINLIK